MWSRGPVLESFRAGLPDVGFGPLGDLAPGLVAEARRRLPRWADRIELGNALGWTPGDGRRFDFVHVLADVVPAERLIDLVRHVPVRLVALGGRLLLCVYRSAGGTGPDAPTRLADGAGGTLWTATTAWADVP